MNFLLAGCLFGVLFYQGTEPLTVHIRELTPTSLLSHVGEGTTLISISDTLADAEKSGIVKRFPGVLVEPLPHNVADLAGIKTGDVILTIDGLAMKLPGDVSKLLSSSSLVSHIFQIQRGDQKIDITLRPVNGKMGAYVLPNMTPIHYHYPFITSL